MFEGSQECLADTWETRVRHVLPGMTDPSSLWCDMVSDTDWSLIEPTTPRNYHFYITWNNSITALVTLLWCIWCILENLDICNWKQLIIKSMWLINHCELMLAPSLSHHILILILRVNNSDVITHCTLCLSFFNQLETGECTGPRPTATDKFTRFFMMIDVIIQTIKDL